MKTRIYKSENKNLISYFPQYKEGDQWKNYIDRNGEIFFFTPKAAENWLAATKRANHKKNAS